MKQKVVEKEEEQGEEMFDDDMDHFHDSEFDEDEEPHPADEEDPFS